MPPTDGAGGRGGAGDRNGPDDEREADDERKADDEREADGETGAPPTRPEAVREELVRFARGLRYAGADVPANAVMTAAEALATVGLDDRERVRAALAAALLTRADDRATFDRLFPRFWRRLREILDEGEASAGVAVDERASDRGLPQLGEEEEALEVEADADDVGEKLVSDSGRRRVVSETEVAEESEDVVAAQYSPSGHREPIAEMSASAEPDLRASVARLTDALAALTGRRSESVASGERVDARRALRRSYGTGGVVVSMPERARKRTAVRGVVLVDVSRSVLDVIDRDFLLGFLRTLHEEWRAVRTFFFDSDIREVTDAFDAPSGDVARELSRAEAEWGGGTRIGDALVTVRDAYPDAVDRRTAVLVVSDGLEMGDVERLEEGVVWLTRRAGTTLWLNPLAASADYEPSCRGMDAALPYVDGLFAFTDADDLGEVARQLERRAPGQPLGYRQDARRTEDAG